MSSAILTPPPLARDPVAEDAVAILLVDDDPKNLTALESILECPEHRLTKARTASEALMALMNQSYAAIVLDVQMPEMSGIELARLIKQRRKTQHIPILFLTAHYRENEDVVQGYDVGAVDYLTKPVHPAVLRSKVGVFVDLFRKTRALAEVNRAMESEIIERKTAEERFRVVVEAAPSAMLVFTGDGELHLVNSQAERLFGRSRHELINARIHDLVDVCALPLLGEMDSHNAVEIEVHDKAGRLIPVEARFTTINSNDHGRWLASFVDITERKRSEESLRRANAELEAKNIALERQAEERNLRLKAESARAEAEAANAAKDRFLAMLSHELRTPLSPVLHSVTLLNGSPDTTPEVRDLLETIRRNVLLEARLIDDLLDLARIRNGKLQLDLQPADAHQLMHHALEICGPEISAHGLRVDVHMDAGRCGLRADPARIQQIFWNLINNSIKHTQPGGVITIATSNDTAAGKVQIKVTDTGSGIEREKLSRIFDAFEQGGEHEASKGLGLGLAISKALAEFHGGTIAASSEGAGKGATFVVTLPVANVGAVPAAPAQGEGVGETKPLRLLVVDDHRDTVVTLRALLRRRGYEVRSAESVTAALEAAEDFAFDVLVTDIGLPDGSGVGLFERLKKIPAHRDIRGVAVSGFGMDEDIARSKTAGFTEHLTKPIDFSLLERCLGRMAREEAILAR